LVVLARENRALRRRLKEAKLKMAHACLEDLDYSGRKLDRALIRQLATCRWVAEHQYILITGPTGVGKSFLACALGQQACRHRQRVIYRPVGRLGRGSCPKRDEVGPRKPTVRDGDHRAVQE
jgi:DNA replication protein DnaC